MSRIAALAARLRGLYRDHSTLLAATAALVLAGFGLVHVRDHGRDIFWLGLGGRDIEYYFEWARDWASGNNVYLRPDRPEYPPASMPLLYPIAGWLDWRQTRLLMASLSLLGVACLVWFVARGTRARTFWQVLLATLLVIDVAGLNVALSNGQLSPLIVPLVLAATFLLHRRPPHWSTDLAAAAMLVAALVKPSISATFLWLALIYPAQIRWRPLLLVGVGYALLTAFALAMFAEPTVDAFLAPVRHGILIAPTSLDPNFHYVINKLGLPILMLPATAASFAILGGWVLRHRRRDLWLLLAVSAMITRFWTYHRVYEDVLLLIVEISLWRIVAEERSPHWADMAATALVLNAFVLLLPAMLQNQRWYDEVVFLTQGFVWAPTFLFLLWYAEAKRSAEERVAIIHREPVRDPSTA